MPQITMTFKLPDEENEHRLALNGSKYFCCLWDIHNWVRNKLKHGELTTEEEEAYTQVQNLILEHVDLNEID